MLSGLKLTYNIYGYFCTIGQETNRIDLSPFSSSGVRWNQQKQREAWRL